MKILYITVRSDFGGGPRHVAQLIDNMPMNADVYVAYPKSGEPYGILWDADKRIKGVCHIPYRRFSVSTLFKLWQFVRLNGIDMIHSHGNGAGIYSRLLKLVCMNVKVVHTFHGISDVYSSKFKMCLSYFVGWLLSPLADIYIAVSNGERDMAIKRRFSKSYNTRVIYNGIANANYTHRTTVKHNIEIVTLSRFDYQKNMQYMFRIAERIKDLPVCFTWVGDGEDRAELERKAKEECLDIRFIGFSDHPMDYLKRADWYMSTSRFEGLPYALIEAASVGLPLLASDVKGNNEVVKDGYNGFLFKTTDEAVELIRQIVNGKMDYVTLSRNSISYYQQNFTLETMIGKLLSVYRSLNDL